MMAGSQGDRYRTVKYLHISEDFLRPLNAWKLFNEYVIYKKNGLFTTEVKLKKDAKVANNKKQMNTRKTLSISSTDLSVIIQYFVLFQGLLANLHGVESHIKYCLGGVLTRGLDFVDILQQLLSLVDDIEGEVVHGQGLVSVVLQPLLGQCQVLCVEIIHLTCQLLVPGLQVRNDLRTDNKITLFRVTIHLESLLILPPLLFFLFFF